MAEKFRYYRDPMGDCCCEVEPHEHGDYVALADHDALAARLAEAKRLLREAMKWWDYGASWPGSEYRASGLNERIYAFLGATDSADARCFRCGHAAHNGDCVNVAPCGECGATDRHYSGCTHAYQRVALTVSASSAEALGVKP